MLAAPGNAGWLLGMMGPVFSFTAIAATQNMGGRFLGTVLALVTFYGCVLAK
jgi:hypothetical protein